ncbi:arylformamidase [Virgibacillus profundi]|uniref:Kynurenine formamidase n=1 Tax=Virgibacillus profundi TaxID=2024555 RepID=A0A2A2I7W7_9BACI|nr:arylformamidase [Virgibacillus profundi]PAV28091.1 arylformamidase [Virgibacillus profundi]PXY52396.1 arylformamidase [Virgibacillus profundi]
MTKWIDISQRLTNDMACWPGDTPFSFSLTYSKEQTGSVNIGQMTASLHTGTHVDAPFHYDDNGKTIDQLDINRYIGRAVVIDVSHVEKITANVLQEFDLDGVKRLLLHTSLPNNPKRFPDTMPILDPDTAPYLKEKGVILIGVDMPSVDPADSKNIETHQALYKHGINILENIMLDHVQTGTYELIALPLSIDGADGSPVRAVIRPIKESGNLYD